MIKRWIVVTAITVLLLSACGGQEQAPTATLAPTNTEAPAPVVTEPPVAVTETTVLPPTEAVATISATAEIPRPTNDPNCTNSASFVADVTIPDNTEIAGGTTFVKTWRIVNTGTCIWGPDYTLTHYSQERMGAPASVPLGVTFPGQTLDISLSLTAPNAVGKYQGNFVIKNPKGLIMKINDDSRLWLIIQVTSPAASTATATSAITVQPTNTSAGTGSSGTGFANATCSFSIDQAKLSQVINGVNAYRAQNGLPAYTVNAQLAKAAQAHAADMACNNLTGHTGSDKSTVESRVAASGYVATFESENVYYANPPGTGQDAVNWWINDQSDTRHRLSLISDTYIHIGVGYAFFNNTGYYVIVFATP